MAVAAERLTAAEIYQRVEHHAQEELKRRSVALAVSGLGAGIAMGLTGLGVAAALGVLGDGEWQRFVSAMLYPNGSYLAWLAAATLGNIVGGVLIVSLLNYGQVHPDEDD